jgi:PDZ domain-containing protein
MRRLVLIGSVALVAAALVFVPLPLVELGPGPAIDLVPLVHLATPPVDHVTGRLLLTSVDLAEPSAADAATALVRSDRELLLREDVIPPGVNEREYVAAERAVFAESARVAAAIGLRQAGYRVAVSGQGAQVVGLVKGSSADGVLHLGDVITAVDGRAISLASDLEAATARATTGQTVTLTIHRVDAQLVLRVRLHRVSELGRPGLGVAVRTRGERIREPAGVRIDGRGIGGPSAGLMMALTVYDLTQPHDLTRGRTVAGMGTIDLLGRVGPIGGIREKVIGARRAGATIFLAPRDEAKRAAAAAPTGISVVPVSSLTEAIAALRGTS